MIQDVKITARGDFLPLYRNKGIFELKAAPVSANGQLMAGVEEVDQPLHLGHLRHGNTVPTATGRLRRDR